MSCIGVLNAVRTPFDRVKFLLACSEVKSLDVESAQCQIYCSYTTVEPINNPSQTQCGESCHMMHRVDECTYLCVNGKIWLPAVRRDDLADPIL